MRKLTFAAIFVAAFAAYVTSASHAGGLNAPPEPGDSHDYDAIAFNLWKGRGYGYHWSDPEWRQPYLGRRGYDGVLGRQSDYYPTTYRPPAFPILLSGVYALTDRNFAAWRVLNCAIVAGVVVLSAAIAARFGGLLAAPLAAFLVLQSPQLTRYSRMFMTEGIATFLITLLAWVWVTNSTKPSTIARGVASGLILGALMASRSIYVLWVPLALFVPGAEGPAGARRAWTAKAVCLATCLLVIGPWWVRNILVTGAFMPTGTQAPLNLPAGFGPRALEYEGMWRGIRGYGVEELEAEKVNPYSVEFEVRLAKYRSAVTMQWMREHPGDVLRLLYLHVWQEIRPHRAGLWDWLLPAAAIAALFFRKSPGIGIVVLMVCANMVSIALTWGAGGRFMIPVQPLMLALVSAAVVAGTRELIAAARRARPEWRTT